MVVNLKSMRSPLNPQGDDLESLERTIDSLNFINNNLLKTYTDLETYLKAP